MAALKFQRGQMLDRRKLWQLLYPLHLRTETSFKYKFYYRVPVFFTDTVTHMYDFDQPLPCNDQEPSVDRLSPSTLKSFLEILLT